MFSVLFTCGKIFRIQIKLNLLVCKIIWELFYHRFTQLKRSFTKRISDLTLNYQKVHKFKFMNEMLDYQSNTMPDLENEIEQILIAFDQWMNKFKAGKSKNSETSYIVFI